MPSVLNFNEKLSPIAARKKDLELSKFLFAIKIKPIKNKSNSLSV
jgi:hypothetical protein